MEDYEKYTSMGVCTEPKQMANACSAEAPSGWDEFDRRLSILVDGTARMAEMSGGIKEKLVGGCYEGENAKIAEKPALSFLDVAMNRVNRLESLLASVHYDLIAIKNGRA